jgi:hypothetical protein
MARLRIGGEVQEKLSMSRRSKDIGDAFAGGPGALHLRELLAYAI